LCPPSYIAMRAIERIDRSYAHMLRSWLGQSLRHAAIQSGNPNGLNTHSCLAACHPV